MKTTRVAVIAKSCCMVARGMSTSVEWTSVPAASSSW